jgi:3-deoxy-manno-octulosonate cytidylyltransferase (CMP-KDO synthetase)
MKKIAVIPARYAATRFPGKLMQLLGDKTVIAQTYLATKATQLFDDIIIATDSEVIKTEVEQYGAAVFQSKLDHESGTDRIAEAVKDMNADVIVNVQGDTPFVQKEALQKLLQLFEEPTVEVASLMEIIADDESLKDPNVVKVCINKKNESLFFSRSIIPYPRNTYTDITHYKHIGVYAFRKEAILKFTKWEVTLLEDAEKIECLRFLEHGIPLKMALTQPMGIDINTPEDLERAQLLFNK